MGKMREEIRKNPGEYDPEIWISSSEEKVRED